MTRRTLPFSFFALPYTPSVLDELLHHAGQLRQIDVPGIRHGHAVAAVPARQFPTTLPSRSRSTRPSRCAGLRQEKSGDAARSCPLAQEFSLTIEHLDPLVVAIGDVHAALRIGHHIVGQPEFTGSCSTRAPLQQEFSVRRVLHHSGAGVAVGDVNVALAANATSVGRLNVVGPVPDTPLVPSRMISLPSGFIL